MKKVLFLFAFILFAAFSHSNAAITLVTSQGTAFGAIGGTGAALTTTGATLIVIAIGGYQQATGPNISDSKGNTWTICTTYEGSGAQAGVVFYYCVNPTVGASHTFTTTSHFANIGIFAFSGTRTSSPKDQENGQFVATLGSTVTPGSITPTVDNCVVLTVVMNYNGSQPTMPSGYTGFTFNTSTSFAGGFGYKIQTTAGAENPSWANMTVGNNGACAVIDFFPPAATSTANGSFFLNMMR